MRIPKGNKSEKFQNKRSAQRHLVFEKALRMDGLMDGQTDLRTDGWTNGLTDRPSYLGACTHLNSLDGCKACNYQPK